MDKFKPHTQEPSDTRTIVIWVGLKMHERIRLAASASNIPMKALVVQALEYALDNMELNDS